MSEAQRSKTRRAAEIARILAGRYPSTKVALRYDDPFQLLVATVLSAQCTDKRVNLVTPGLFKRYPDPAAFAAAPQEDLEEAIRSTGFYRNKARAIRAMSASLVERHSGRVPAAMEDLTALTGVGRKTANCVLGQCFDVPGVVVDTHVLRLSRLLGLSDSQDPEVIEHDIMALLPSSEWTAFSNRLIHHGRAVCVARKPDCGRCPISHLCPSSTAGRAPDRGKRRA
jgi:endonuclease-3